MTCDKQPIETTHRAELEPKKMSTWKQNPDLMERLTEAQNSPALEHQDVMTWAAMCSTRDELLRHVENCERRAENYVALAKTRRARKAA
jgi:hypothetical protein